MLKMKTCAFVYIKKMRKNTLMKLNNSLRESWASASAWFSTNTYLTPLIHCFYFLLFHDFGIGAGYVCCVGCVCCVFVWCEYVVHPLCILVLKQMQNKRVKFG